jgi:hypothetical protein
MASENFILSMVFFSSLFFTIECAVSLVAAALVDWARILRVVGRLLKIQGRLWLGLYDGGLSVIVVALLFIGHVVIVH